MAGIKGLMSLLFLMDNSKNAPMEAIVSGVRKLPKEKRDILKALAEDKNHPGVAGSKRPSKSGF